MPARPFIKFYISDWDGDAQLAQCSLAAQGLWIRLICAMHKANPKGVLPNDTKRLAAIGRTSTTEARRLVNELVAEGVATFTEDGKFVYSRRVVRDEARAERARENGHRSAGNPLLQYFADSGLTDDDQGSVNRNGISKNGTSAVYAHIPEIRTKTSLRSVFARGAPKKPDRSWCEPLEQRVAELRQRRLDALSADERFELARLHALRFCNCRAAENTNRKAARKIAAGIANLVTDRRYRDLTVDEYVSAAAAAWKRGGEAPMWSAFEAVGAIEYEAK